MIAGARGELRVRQHTIDGTPRWRALVPTENRHQPPDIMALQALGPTRREAGILQLLTAAESNQQIARHLDISPATVRKHLEHIYTKLGVNSRSQAIARALRGS